MHARPYGLRIVEHTAPSRAVAGETCGVRLTVENSGAMIWSADPPDGHPVRLFVLFGDELYQAVPLPHGDVPPGGTVTFHFALRFAHSGRQRLRLELVHELRAWFSDQGCPGVALDVQVDEALADGSSAALARSLARNLWHYQPTSGIRRFRDGTPVPLFVTHAKGCRIQDPEGHTFIDYTMGWGSMLLGYADDRIQHAIAERLASAPLAPFPDPVEMEVSDMLAEDFPSAEMVAFGKNGSDVCTLAARLARLFTGRRLILSCGFHGWQDFAVEPKGELRKFRFNDTADFRRQFDEHRRDLAAIMIEPAGPFAGPDEGPCGEADPGFLEMLAASARDAGALLIFDEIITGYRYPAFSVQRASGVTADLTCLGKALAAGMPLAAVAGRRDVFHAGFARTHYCPTFKAEIYSLAAAKAAITIYRREPVAAHVWDVGNTLKRAIDARCRALGLDAECRGPGFRFSLVFRDADPVRRRLLRTLYMQELLRAGIVTVNGVMLPGYAHRAADVATTVECLEKVLGVIAETRDLDRKIEIPLL